MKIFGAAVLGLVGGWLLGFLLSSGVHIALEFLGGGADSTGVAIAVGLVPYGTALIGAVVAPVVAARRAK
ncbi:DUF5957 family protein [Nocardiopsis composta]|uniref:ABC-type antimicrobial peptide transport system permease subunit n=1 Tax=Nocardiopsis composta TaxID=157465 RepID=A0A7W8QLI1_9ACTN|nr:DUF5957 family protein [Nocardiopsis composta]MBB5432194.1 ABC-type antimicrobial peptide transport system permease subunit [Nocardiopsis composta]